MPYLESADLMSVLEIFGTFLYPLALTLQLPIYISLMAWEKEGLFLVFLKKKKREK